MNVGIAYANHEDQVWMRIEVPDESSVEQVIEYSAIRQRFPSIDLERQKVGIFGVIKKLTDKVADGDRVEIYLPIEVDPGETQRRLPED